MYVIGYLVIVIMAMEERLFLEDLRIEFRHVAIVYTKCTSYVLTMLASMQPKLHISSE